jgi:hypothetical protein
MNKNEELVKVFLRLNGYFSVDNFIIHDGNSEILTNGDTVIPQSTETDLLGIRMPFQNERTGQLHIANYPNLILNNELIDLIIVESKSGVSNKPNRTWKNDLRIDNIKYLVRFFGVTEDENVINEIANNLIQNYQYVWNNYSFRYIIVSEDVNEHYSNRGVTYFKIDEVLNFIVDTRGECWSNANMGIASQHQQWHPFMNKLFDIANRVNLSTEDKKTLIREYIDEP